MNYRSPRKTFLSPFKDLHIDRNFVFFLITAGVTAIIIVRLFQLQIISYDHYNTIANEEHYGYSEIQPHRGEIFIKDYASNENVRIATNSTLDLLFADPTLIKNKKSLPL